MGAHLNTLKAMVAEEVTLYMDAFIGGYVGRWIDLYLDENVECS